MLRRRNASKCERGSALYADAILSFQGTTIGRLPRNDRKAMRKRLPQAGGDRVTARAENGSSFRHGAEARV